MYSGELATDGFILLWMSVRSVAGPLLCSRPVRWVIHPAWRASESAGSTGILARKDAQARFRTCIRAHRLTEHCLIARFSDAQEVAHRSVLWEDPLIGRESLGFRSVPGGGILRKRDRPVLPLGLVGAASPPHELLQQRHRARALPLYRRRLLQGAECGSRPHAPGQRAPRPL